MKLEELVGKKILWDATPQSEMGMVEIHGQADYDRYMQRVKERAGYYFFVNVWNCRASLQVMLQREDGSARSEVIETKIVTDNDLYNAIDATGGAINISGHYPASEKILTKLRKKLEGLKET